MGFYMTIMDESSTVSAVLGGYILEFYGFKSLFAIGAATAAICLCIVLTMVPDPKELHHIKDIVAEYNIH